MRLKNIKGVLGYSIVGRFLAIELIVLVIVKKGGKGVEVIKEYFYLFVFLCLFLSLSLFFFLSLFQNFLFFFFFLCFPFFYY